MSIERFSERDVVVQPVALRPEETPTVEMPIIEISPDLRTDDCKGETVSKLATPSRSFFKAWWQKVTAYLLGHLV